MGTTWHHLGTTWTTIGSWLGQLGCHLAQFENYMDTWSPTGTNMDKTLSPLGTTRRQHGENCFDDFDITLRKVWDNFDTLTIRCCTTLTQMRHNFEYLVTIGGVYLCPVDSILPILSQHIINSSKMSWFQNHFYWRICCNLLWYSTLLAFNR